MKIAFIGGGNMASALIGGLLKQHVAATNLHAIDIDANARMRLSSQFGIQTGETIDATLRGYDAIVLAVKPQMLKLAAQALAPHLTTQLVISIAAGIRVADLAAWLNGYAHIVRAMPNTPALIGMGITGLTALPDVDQASRELATRILSTVGQALWLEDEAKIEAITAISGSGPAYVFYFIEALQDAAQQLGLNPTEARSLATATFNGATQLAAKSTETASVLRERVTSKGGVTAAALASFNAQGIKEAITRGVLAAHARALEMGEELGKA